MCTYRQLLILTVPKISLLTLKSGLYPLVNKRHFQIMLPRPKNLGLLLNMLLPADKWDVFDLSLKVWFYFWCLFFYFFIYVVVTVYFCCIKHCGCSLWIRVYSSSLFLCPPTLPHKHQTKFCDLRNIPTLVVDKRLTDCWLVLLKTCTCASLSVHFFIF